VRWKLVSTSLLGLAICAPLPGCGSDQEERGLAPAEEEAVPMDATEERMTEEERREQQEREDAAREEQEFEAEQHEAE
jgi:hypothetical protein